MAVSDPAPYHLPMPAAPTPDEFALPPLLAPDGSSAAADHTEAAKRVLRRFRTVFNAVKTHFQQVEKQAGIGGAQLWALSIVEAQPDMGVGALAGAMDVHQTTASNLVKSLSTAALITSHRDGTDRRVVRLRITPAGEAVLHKAPGPFTGVLPEALASLDVATLARLDHDMAVLIDRLRADSHAEGIPLAHM